MTFLKDYYTRCNGERHEVSVVSLLSFLFTKNHLMKVRDFLSYIQDYIARGILQEEMFSMSRLSSQMFLALKGDRFRPC